MLLRYLDGPRDKPPGLLSSDIPIVVGTEVFYFKALEFLEAFLKLGVTGISRGDDRLFEWNAPSVCWKEVGGGLCGGESPGQKGDGGGVGEGGGIDSGVVF